MKSILITGSNGFIGSQLCKYFFGKDYFIYGVSKSPPKKTNLNFFKDHFVGEILGEKVQIFIKEIKPDYIFHCAGNSSIQNSIKDPKNDFYNNSYLTFEFLNFIRQFSPHSEFYFFSSAAVYGDPPRLPISETLIPNPISPYGYHKYISENMCFEFSKLYSLKIVVLRIFSAYGEGLKRQILYDLMQKFLNDDKILLKGTGKESRDFIHVFDICKAIELIMNKKNKSLEIYNIGNGEEISIEKIAELFSVYLKSSKKIEFDNKKNLGMPLNWRSDITKLHNIGFRRSVSFAKGVEEYIDWFKKDILIK